MLKEQAYGNLHVEMTHAEILLLPECSVCVTGLLGLTSTRTECLITDCRAEARGDHSWCVWTLNELPGALSGLSRGNSPMAQRQAPPHPPAPPRHHRPPGASVSCSHVIFPYCCPHPILKS
uniref:Uncharacterized protein n=1 Tax=Myotis myotis TaxID=51298 RepID=A0A7J7V3Q8_MYOMY|nr:hypothetical protein mMyoMyo1_008527 [Myotis myotis]